MFEPVACAPDLPSESKDLLRDFLSRFSDTEDMDTMPALVFVDVLAGEKPAMIFQPNENQFPNHRFAPHQGLADLCDQLGLHVSFRAGTNFVFVAASRERLDLVPTNGRRKRSRGWAKRLGVILGYPPSAVQTFMNQDQPWTEPADHVRDGHFTPEEIADVGFVPYRMDDSVQCYERAIRRGQRARARYEKLAEEWDLPQLAECVEQQREKFVENATPKVVPADD